MKLWKKWNSLSLFTRIMVGFVLGIIAGLVLGELMSKTSRHSGKSAVRHSGCFWLEPQSLWR